MRRFDVSDLGDLGSQGPITEQQAFQKRDALAANIKEEAHRRYSNKKRPCPKPAPHRFRGQPLHLGPTARGHLQQSTCDVVGYVETHASAAASQDLLRGFDQAGRKPVLSLHPGPSQAAPQEGRPGDTVYPVFQIL